jgi:isoquinoline 1-oxidoreductase beta subunit
VAESLGIKPENVTLRTTFLGGGFGRRLDLDFIVPGGADLQGGGPAGQAGVVARGRHDARLLPAGGVHRLQAGLDAAGKPVALHFQVASQSVTQRAFGLPVKTLDPFMAEAARWRRTPSRTPSTTW